MSAWRKAYFRWHLINELAPYLSERFTQEHFSFHGTALRGIERNEPRWKLGIALLNDSMGEALGRLYVARYFPPEYKTRADHLVANLLATYRDDIETLDWMNPETKKKAEEKLARYGVKIGYPAKWRDYGALRIDRDDLVGNVIRANTFEYDRNLNKLGKPVDRSEWSISPQTVNAHYDPEHNEIVFSAAVLQPPFFNPAVEDAANYGSAGFSIAHEISHGFDDQGSQYDGDGKLETERHAVVLVHPNGIAVAMQWIQTRRQLPTREQRRTLERPRVQATSRPIKPTGVLVHAAVWR